MKGLRVGITGGIGSGKTTVCRLFETLDVPVYDADYWAKWLLTNDPEIVAGVRSLFGDGAYTTEGIYDRAYVAGVVFSDPGKLAALNALVHPAVERHASDWHAQRLAEGHPYTLKEAALMIESGSYKHLDYLILVAAPEALRVERVMRRDGMAEEQVRARMKSQLPEEQKRAFADRIIENDGQHSLVKQVWETHRELLRRCGVENS